LSDYSLAIDLGSTCFKAAIFDKNLQLIGNGVHYLSYLHRDSKVELSVEEVETAFSKIIEEAIESAAIDASEVCGVGISSQAQTFMLTENNIPVTNFISWEDSRGLVRKDGVFSDFKEHSSFYEMLSPLQIAQLLRISAEKDMAPTTKVISLPSYLIYLLSGEFVIDNNLAAMSGCFSIPENRWKLSYLEYCGLNESSFCEVIPLGSVAGNLKENSFSLKRGIPVYCCGNDQTAGAAGVELADNDMLMTLGTAQVLYQRAATMPASEEQIIRGPYLNSGFYHLMCTSGGSLISKVIQMNVGIKNFDDFFAKVEEGHMIPDLTVNDNGEIEFPQLSSPQDIAFSVLKYICLSMKNMYIKFVEIGKIPNKLLVAGGGNKNKIWLDMLTNELGKELLPVDASPLHGVARIMKLKQHKNESANHESKI